MIQTRFQIAVNGLQLSARGVFSSVVAELAASQSLLSGAKVEAQQMV